MGSLHQPLCKRKAQAFTIRLSGLDQPIISYGKPALFNASLSGYDCGAAVSIQLSLISLVYRFRGSSSIGD